MNMRRFGQAFSLVVSVLFIAWQVVKVTRVNEEHPYLWKVVASTLVGSDSVGAKAGSASEKDARDCIQDEDQDVRIAACTRFIELDRKDAHAYRRRGDAYYHKGDRDRAIADYDQAIRLDPKYADAYGARGLAYYARGDMDHAIADCNQAILLDPKFAEAYNIRGIVYYARGDMDHAIADYNQAIRLDPKFTQAYKDRGLAYYAGGDYGRAIADYDQVIRLDPKLAADAYNSRSLAYYARGDYDRAIAGYDQAIQLDPKLATAYNNRGTAYSGKGDYDRAITDLNKAISLDPKPARPYYHRGAAYYAKGDRDHAIADYDQAIRLDPKYAAAYNGRGDAYYAKGDKVRAIADYDQAIRLDPKLTTAYNSRGLTYYARGDYDRAIADFDQAIRLDPQYAVAYNNRGAAQNGKGDRDRAIADLNEAIQLDPTVSRPYYHRGLAYEAKGEVEKALADLRAYSERAPESGDGRDAIARLEKKIAESQPAPPPPPVASNEKRVALVIGNSAYAAVPALPNPKRDAASIAEALRRENIDATLVLDATRAQMVAALQAFRRKAETSDWALVYFAGHGIEVAGRNYLIPIDAKLDSDGDAEVEAVSLDHVQNDVQSAKKLRLVMLDACRNNPFAAHMTRTSGLPRAVDRGLAPVEPSPGTMVVFATRAGSIASDGVGAHSPFTTAFLRELRTPGLEVRLLFDSVRDDVLEATNGGQQPFTYGSLSGRQRYYFRAKP